jgi:hypothetical protein
MAQGDYTKQIEKLWNAAWDQRNAEIIASEGEHAAALAAVRAEKAAPGSAETMGKAAAMWTALRGITEVTAAYCVEAGYPPRPSAAAAETAEGIGRTDADGVFVWLDNYCLANPLVSLAAASAAFFQAHPIPRRTNPSQEVT